MTEHIPAERYNLRWLMRRAFRGGFVHETQNPSSSRLLAMLRATALAAGFVGLIPLAALRGRTASVRVALRGCTQAGRLWSLFGGVFEEYSG